MDYIWIAVSQDKYEYPTHVADSARELGKLLGISINSVYSAQSRTGKFKNQKRKIYSIEVEDDFKEKLEVQ